MYQTVVLCEKEKCIKTSLGEEKVPGCKLQKGGMKPKGLQKLGGLLKCALVGVRMLMPLSRSEQSLAERIPWN